MITKCLKGPLLAALFFATNLIAGEVAITIDDFDLRPVTILNGTQRDERILATLKKHNIQAALFLTCRNLENPAAKARIPFWEKAGHTISNHTYSHLFYDEAGFEAFSADILKCHEIIKNSPAFEPLFRFPYLKGGNTAKQRDEIQSYLKKLGYRNGYVSIDASDWLISMRLEIALSKNPKADTRPYRDYYLKHMWERTIFYDELAKKHWKKPVKHTLLMHHNLLNALFLDDLIQMYKDKGWKVISAKEAFKDPLYMEIPEVAPFRDSILWLLAKKAGDKTEHYPGENSVREKEELKKLGL